MQGRFRLGVGWITLFLMGTDLFVISPLLPFISEEYKISSSAAGWMVTVFSVTYACAAPFFGWLSDRKGRRSFITVGLLLFAVSNLLTAFAPSFVWLIVSRISAGLSVASITPLIYAIIGDIAPPARRGTWISIIVSGHLTALWAGAPLGTLIEHYYGWRSVFVGMAVIGVLLAVVNFKTWGSIPKSDLTRYLPEGNLLRILGSVCVTAVWAVSMYSIYVYLGAALYAELRFSSSEIALAVTLYGVGAVGGSLAGGHLTDKFGGRNISQCLLFSLTLILICLGMVFTSSVWIYFLLLIWALVGYAGFASYQARLVEEYPRERGIVMAWNMTALYIGISVGSMIGGLVISKWGYDVLPYVCSAAALVSFLLSTQKVQLKSHE